MEISGDVCCLQRYDVFPTPCELGHKGGEVDLNFVFKYELQFRYSSSLILYITSSSVGFQNKAYPSICLILKTINIIFAILKYIAFICASYSHWGIIRVCGCCIICVEEMLQYVWCTKAQGSEVACLGSTEICSGVPEVGFHGALSSFTYLDWPLT